MSAAFLDVMNEPTNEDPASGGGGSQSDNPDLTPDAPPKPAESSPSSPKPKRPRGFAAMDRTLVSEIARKGGKAAHTAGTAHEFTSDEARVAGQKGGRATHAKRRKADATPKGER
jgi:general stress protein YciG